MGVITNIKDKFNSPDIFNVYKDCMYMSTLEKYNQLAEDYINNEDIKIFGFLENNRIVGVIVINQTQYKTAEIKGIAVDPKYRKCGVGKQLVLYVCKELEISALTAETDKDSVNFYMKCGFSIEEFMKSGEYRRYRCKLLG